LTQISNETDLYLRFIVVREGIVSMKIGLTLRIPSHKILRCKGDV
jgi:hypothetical protein